MDFELYQRLLPHVFRESVVFLLYFAGMLNGADCVVNLEPALHSWEHDVLSFFYYAEFDLLVFLKNFHNYVHE